jgi:hypothetical protein
MHEIDRERNRQVMRAWNDLCLQYNPSAPSMAPIDLGFALSDLLWVSFVCSCTGTGVHLHQI